MLEFAIGVIAAPWIYIVGFLLMMSLDYNGNRGWVVFYSLILSVGIAYHVYNSTYSISPTVAVFAVVVWLLVGFLWSYLRWSRHCSDLLIKLEKKSFNLDSAKQDLDVRNKISTITYWILLWPVSLPVNLLGDIIAEVSNFVRKYLVHIYEAKSTSTIAALEAIKAAEEEKRNERNGHQ